MALSAISPVGVSTALNYARQTTSAGAGIAGEVNADPGNTNAPIIFEPPSMLSGGDLLVWIIATGGASWGGCEVWVSVDNTTYAPIGTILAGGIQGLLAGAFSSGSDPDTVNSLLVDLTESAGQLIAGTMQDADDFLTLCFCDGELIAYSAATLTSANHYTLGAYIRRGCYGSTIGSHASSSMFGRIVASTFSQKFPQNLIGRTLYFKFPAANALGGGAQDVSAVPFYTYTLTGVGLSPGPGSSSGLIAVRRIAQGSTTPLSISSDYLLEVIAGSAAITTVDAPSAPSAGQRFEIKDKTGLIDAHPIVFTAVGGQTVEGAASYSLNQNFGGFVVTWDGSDWSVT